AHHARYVRRVFAYHGKLQVGDHLATACLYVAHIDARDAHIVRHGGFKISEEARPGEVLAVYERVRGVMKLALLRRKRLPYLTYFPVIFPQLLAQDVYIALDHHGLTVQFVALDEDK